MKTYIVDKDGQVEGLKEGTEVIPTFISFSYALFEDLKALLDGEEEIDEDKFLEFLDEKSIEIEDSLKSAWKDWKEEQ